MKIITLYVEESADGSTVYAEIADALDALAVAFGYSHQGLQYLEGLAERTRQIESLHQAAAVFTEKP